MPNYERWTESMMRSWASLEGAATARLFTRDVEYYETPNGVPCGSWEDVERLWEPVPTNQKNITYSFEVVMSGDRFGLINWKMERDLLAPAGWAHQSIDGIFLVSVTEDNLCNYFKQWRHVEARPLA